jgi:hypothetical protein
MGNSHLSMKSNSFNDKMFTLINTNEEIQTIKELTSINLSHNSISNDGLLDFLEKLEELQI